MYELLHSRKLDNFKRLRNHLIPIVIPGFIVFLTLITFLIEHDCNQCNNFGFAPQAFGLSKPESNSGPLIVDPSFKAQVYFNGIKFPSSMAFLGNNDILVLEKNDGTVKRIVNGVMLADPLLKVNVSSVGERGMLGIAILKRENQSKSPYIFLYYTAATSKSKPFGNMAGNNSTLTTNRLVRYEMSNDRLVNGKLIFEVLARGIVHNGGKMIVGPDNNLYITIGDTSGSNPQKDNLPNGRAGILRFTPDGDSVKNESGKSIMGNTSPTNKYYAYGLRNSFGIGFDPVSGKLWDTENGPSFGDEINLVEPGFNSGWDTIQGYWAKQDPTPGHEVLIPNPKDIASFGGKLKYRPPELATYPTVGFTALTFINTSNYGKEYENDMLVGDFHNGNLYHFDLNKNRTDLELNGGLDDKIANNVSDLNSVILGQGFGGITDIKVGPDGSIYILAVYQGGDNCYPKPLPGCITYTSSLPGTVFKIVHANRSM